MAIPVFLFSLASPAQTAPTASSPAANPQPVCAGSYNVIRVDEIKPGMLPTFMQAVAGHHAWYAAAGAPDKIIAMRVVEIDPTTKARHLSETTVLTSHIEPAKRDRPLPPEGDSYKAFTDLYKQSSTITVEYHACIPAM
jgi:hypothetical protein